MLKIAGKYPALRWPPTKDMIGACSLKYSPYSDDFYVHISSYENVRAIPADMPEIREIVLSIAVVALSYNRDPDVSCRHILTTQAEWTGDRSQTLVKVVKRIVI